MLLDDIVNQDRAVPLRDISLNAGLAAQMQDGLSTIGILDPPADGQFGPVSTWALTVFHGTLPEAITPKVAKALLNASAPPLTPADALTQRLLTAMDQRGHWLARAPGCINIIYVEGMGPDGTRNDNTPNQFNDARFVLRVEAGGTVSIAGAWEATTEPGRHFTVNPESALGAARISFGQFKAWAVGNHKGDPNHEALVQSKPITVFRDRNKDFRRDGDTPQTGLFGINQHHGFDFGRNDIRNASAGCLVGRLKSGHRDFMRIVKSDPRFAASRSYTFLTTILPEA